TITDSERLLSETDIGHSAPNRLCVRRPYQPRHFLAVAQENQRRPQLDPERPPEAPAGTILHLQVVQVRVIIEGLLQMALGSLAMAAPIGTELQQRRALEGVQFLARGRAVRIMGEHGHVNSWVTGSVVFCLWTARAHVGVMYGEGYGTSCCSRAIKYAQTDPHKLCLQVVFISACYPYTVDNTGVERFVDINID